jgi:hypothetical protein
MAFAASVSIACSATRSASSSPPAENATINQSSQPSPTQVGLTPQDKLVCSLNRAQAPVLHGLKLQMTPEEVLALFPGSKDDSEVRSDLSRPANRFGVGGFLIRPGKFENRDQFSGISQISFSLLDGRASNFTVSYNGPEWPHVDQFVTKFVEGTNLPAVDQWTPYVGMDHQLKTLTCTDFEVRVFAGGPGGNLNYVLLQDLEAHKTLNERRKKAREQASPTPGNQ